MFCRSSWNIRGATVPPNAGFHGADGQLEVPAPFTVTMGAGQTGYFALRMFSAPQRACAAFHGGPLSYYDIRENH
jgi:hypothetical protein